MNTPTTQTHEISLSPLPSVEGRGLRLVELWDGRGSVGAGAWAVDHTLVVGRQGDVSLSDPSASREHFTVQPSRYPGMLLLLDLGSHNGTYVNSVKVSRALVAAGDVIRVGKTLLAVDREACPGPSLADEMGARSAEMLDAINGAVRMASANLRILLLGETGVGKQVMAEALHRLSGLDGPFVGVNCARLDRETVDSELFGHLRGAFTNAYRDRAGLIAQADGGTLFLDEIGELPLESQARLLQVIEDRVVRPLGADRGVPVDFRLICATNMDLNGAMARGAFRSDLYHRLVDWVVHLPPLHRRVPDIPAILNNLGFSRIERLAVRESLATNLWPGNVRTLAQVARRLRLVESQPDAQRMLFPTGVRSRPRAYEPPQTLPDTAEGLRLLLAAFCHNISAVARHIQRSREVVYRAMERHNLREHDSELAEASEA